MTENARLFIQALAPASPTGHGAHLSPTPSSAEFSTAAS